MQVGRKLFYDIVTGAKLVDTGEWDDAIREKTVDEEIATFPILSERNRDSFDVLVLPYGAYTQDFATCTSYRVNPETKELEFSYHNPNDPEAEPVHQKSLTDQIEELRKENVLLKKDNTLMKAQNQYLSDRTDFHADVLTEIILLINP